MINGERKYHIELKEEKIGRNPIFFLSEVRPAAHVSSGCKSRIRLVVGRI